MFTGMTDSLGLLGLSPMGLSSAEPFCPELSPVVADVDDPFDDFEEDDFDDDFDDDFEEDWEDDLTEDEEFPDTFGGQDEEEEDDTEASPFKDDPDFDDD